MSLPGSLSHLTWRFFDVLLARRLMASEIEAVDGWLSEAEAAVFYSQPITDQRHGYEAALTVVAFGVSDTTVIRAALLHDIGKRHAHLGVIGRSFASILIGLRLPISERMKAYRDHGLVGAGELRDLGGEVLLVEFARHHHGKRPPSISPAVWKVLQAADHPANARAEAWR